MPQEWWWIIGTTGTSKVSDGIVPLASAAPDFVTSTRYIRAPHANHMELLGHREARHSPDVRDPTEGRRVVKLHVIRPERELPLSGLEFDPKVMREMVELGRARARRDVRRAGLN